MRNEEEEGEEGHNRSGERASGESVERTNVESHHERTMKRKRRAPRLLLGGTIIIN